MWDNTHRMQQRDVGQHRMQQHDVGGYKWDSITIFPVVDDNWNGILSILFMKHSFDLNLLFNLVSISVVLLDGGVHIVGSDTYPLQPISIHFNPLHTCITSNRISI